MEDQEFANSGRSRNPEGSQTKILRKAKNLKGRPRVHIEEGQGIPKEAKNKF